MFNLKKKICLASVITAFIITLFIIFLNNSIYIEKNISLISHIIAELISSFVFISVVVLVFFRFTQKVSKFGNIIILGFTYTALMGFLHTLIHLNISYTSNNDVIYFWFATRTAELVTFILIASQYKLKGSNVGWLIVSILLASFTATSFFILSNNLPTTYVEGKGVTLFKSIYEASLAVGFLILSILFFKRYRKNNDIQLFYFAIATYCMALCSFTLTYHLTSLDLNMAWAQVLKIISSVALYRAVFIDELLHPYLMAEKATKLSLLKQQELDTILNNMPISVLRLSADLKIEYANQFATKISPLLANIKFPAPLTDYYPKDVMAEAMPHLQNALNGNKEIFTISYKTLNGEMVHRACTIVPEKQENGCVNSLLCLIEDITDKVNASKEKNAAITEMQELRHALDQHAIVAVTDLNGVILSANDKFCEISKYSLDEVLGKTHKLIKSNQHDRTFFNEMWNTIKQGDVWHGEICNKAKDGSLYWVRTTIVPLLDDANKPKKYIAIRADITARKQVENQVFHMAMHDELTKLPNRHNLRQKLDKLSQEKFNISAKYHALLFIDLDNFKTINDTMGHPDGDILLIAVANRLESIKQPANHIARLGGDEFVFLLTYIDEDKEKCTYSTQKFAEKLRHELIKPYAINGHNLIITPSIGITLFTNAEINFPEIMKQADIAMYQSKDNGKNRVSFFDPALQATIEKQSHINFALNSSLANNEYQLNYQPIYNQQGRLIGFEALLRWHSQTLGAVYPDQFIPLLEESGLIIDVGQWVLETACAKLSEWKNTPALASLTIAVNVSAIQFQQKDFTQLVKNAIENHQIDSSQLKLEITEGVILIDSGIITERMHELKKIGVSLLLDDFGTGYSSLSYLTKFPIDILKIDKHFVDNMLTSRQDETVVHSIISLASGLKMQVVAEGVETFEQFAYLNKLNCEFYQGYWFSKPLALNTDQDVIELLVSNKASLAN